MCPHDMQAYACMSSLTGRSRAGCGWASGFGAGFVVWSDRCPSSVCPRHEGRGRLDGARRSMRSRPSPAVPATRGRVRRVAPRRHRHMRPHRPVQQRQCIRAGRLAQSQLADPRCGRTVSAVGGGRRSARQASCSTRPPEQAAGKGPLACRLRSLRRGECRHANGPFMLATVGIAPRASTGHAAHSPRPSPGCERGAAPSGRPPGPSMNVCQGSGAT